MSDIFFLDPLKATFLIRNVIHWWTSEGVFNKIRAYFFSIFTGFWVPLCTVSRNMIWLQKRKNVTRFTEEFAIIGISKSILDDSINNQEVQTDN